MIDGTTNDFLDRGSASLSLNYQQLLDVIRQHHLQALHGLTLLTIHCDERYRHSTDHHARYNERQMDTLSETPIRTSSFTIDHANYSHARLVDLGGTMSLWVGLGLVAGLVGWAITFGDDPIHGFFGLAIFLFPGLLIFAFLFSLARIWSPKNRHLFERPRSFEFTPDQIAVSMGELGDARYSWSLITRIATPKGWTFLFQGQLLAVAIPDSCIAPEDLRSFRALILAKRVPPKNRVKT